MHVGVWTSLPVRNNQTWVHFHQNLSIFVIFQDFFQYSWASSRLFVNTLNKNTTVKTGNFSRGCWAFCSLHFAAEKNLRLSFPHRRKELCLLVKKVLMNHIVSWARREGGAADETRHRLDGPAPSGLWVTELRVDDQCQTRSSVLFTHTHTGKNVFTMVFNWAVQQFGWSLFILRPSAGLLKVFTLFRDSAGATVKEEWVFGSEEHRQNHL